MTDDLETQLLDLAARVRTLEDQVDPDAIASIHEKLDKLLDETAARPRVFHWDDLEPDEQETLWPELLRWVQNVLIGRYPDADSALRACWWQHPSALDAVTSVWFAWLYAYRSDDAKGYDPAVWQTDRLPALVKQLGDRLASCENGHFPDQPTAEAMSTVPMDYSTISARPSDQ